MLDIWSSLMCYGRPMYCFLDLIALVVNKRLLKVVIIKRFWILGALLLILTVLILSFIHCLSLSIVCILFALFLRNGSLTTHLFVRPCDTNCLKRISRWTSEVASIQRLVNINESPSAATGSTLTLRSLLHSVDHQLFASCAKVLGKTSHTIPPLSTQQRRVPGGTKTGKIVTGISCRKCVEFSPEEMRRYKREFLYQGCRL